MTSVALPVVTPLAEPAFLTPQLPEELAAQHVFVIPAYNEEENLPRLLADFESRPELFPPGSRVLIVDDGSADRTAEVVSSLPRPGAGRAPADGREPGPRRRVPAGIPRGARPLRRRRARDHARGRHDERSRRAAGDDRRGRARGADVVLASWVMVNVKPLRRFLSAGAGWTVRRTLGLEAHTVSSFFRVYRASVLRSAHGALRRPADPRAGVRLQGGGPRQARAHRRDDHGSTGRPGLHPPRGQEQDADPEDGPRVLAPTRTGAVRARARTRMTPSVGIVGGGILGMTAALRLAQSGVRVALYERSPDLGGLVGSFPLGGHAGRPLLPRDPPDRRPRHRPRGGARAGRPVPLPPDARGLLRRRPALLDDHAEGVSPLSDPSPLGRARLARVRRPLPAEARLRRPRRHPAAEVAHPALREEGGRADVGAAARLQVRRALRRSPRDVHLVALAAHGRRRATPAGARSWAGSRAATRR